MTTTAYRSIYRAGLFAGQTVIVTGGGSGIGRCIAHELASLGAALALVGGTGVGYFVWNEWNNLSLPNVIFAILMIGVVGMQLAVGPDAAIAKFLPFYGPRRLIEGASQQQAAILGPVVQTVLYGLALLVVARLFMNRRIAVQRHPFIDPTGDPQDTNASPARADGSN